MDMTAKLFECDRDEMYSYILRLCSKFLVLSLPFLCVCSFFIFVITFYLLDLCVCACLGGTVNGLSQESQQEDMM